MKTIFTLFTLVICLGIISGCTSNYVLIQDYEILESSTTRRFNKLSYDINLTKGAINENRAAIDILNAQIQEASSRLGNINKNIRKVTDLESTFNNKLTSMMDEVVKENERLIKEINKTRQQTTDYSSDQNVNIYNSSSDSDLDVGYYHTVASGESLSKIAHKYQVPIDHIIQANNMDNPDSVYVGQKLFIPDPEED